MLASASAFLALLETTTERSKSRLEATSESVRAYALNKHDSIFDDSLRCYSECQQNRPVGSSFCAFVFTEVLLYTQSNVVQCKQADRWRRGPFILLDDDDDAGSCIK